MPAAIQFGKRRYSLRIGFIAAAILLSVLAVWFVLFPGNQGPFPPQNYPNFRVEFFNDQTGVIVGPRVFHTNDSGRSWSIIDYTNPSDSKKPKDNPRYAKYLVDFVDADWAWQTSGRQSDSVEYSINGGRSWSEPIWTGAKLHGPIVFVTREAGWVLGEVPAVTRDGGKTWKQEATLANLRLDHPYSLDQNHVWLANYWGVIARTADAGQNWEILHTDLKQIRALFFVNPNTGWAVGENGLVASTENGGKDWTIREVEIPYYDNLKLELLDVFFISPELGWITGQRGLILFTKDGGNTWTRASTPTNAPLCSLRFVDPLRGWAVGGHPPPAPPVAPPSNVVLETNDGGQNWKERKF